MVMRKVFIAGGAHTKFIGKFHPNFIWKGHPDFGKRENPNLEWYVKEAALGALKHTDADPSVVDKAYVGNFVGELFDNQGHLGAVLAAVIPPLAGKPIARIEGACASGGLALAAGVDAVEAGADVVLVIGAEVQTTVNAKHGADYFARAVHYRRQRSIDPFTLPCLFARRTKFITESTKTTMEDCARIAVKAYANGNRNPHAHMHKMKMSLDVANTVSDTNPLFLEHPEFKEYVRVSDCSQVSDGGSALLLCSEKGLKKIGHPKNRHVEILACEVATASIAEDPAPTRLDNTTQAANRAYQLAGMKSNDIQVAEVHDCFSINEILMYEALGFAPAGQGARLIREGQTEITGRIPINTGGGLIAFGHPMGATGIKQALEIYRQLNGLCGDYQVKHGPKTGLSANMGGDDRTAVVTIYRVVD